MTTKEAMIIAAAQAAQDNLTWPWVVVFVAAIAAGCFTTWLFFRR